MDKPISLESLLFQEEPKERNPTNRNDYANRKHGDRVHGITFYHSSPVRFRHGDILRGGHEGGSGYEHQNVCMTTHPTPHCTIASGIPGWKGTRPNPELGPASEFNPQAVQDRDWYVYKIEPIGKVHYVDDTGEYQARSAKVLQNLGKAKGFLQKAASTIPGRENPLSYAKEPRVERDRTNKRMVRLKTPVNPDEEPDLEEANTMASGNVSGYTGPLGADTVGTSKKLEKGFWRDRTGKKVKTGSPSVHNKDALALSEDLGAMQDVDTPVEQLHMVKLLWADEPKPKDGVRSGSPELDKDLNESIEEEAGYLYHGTNEDRALGIKEDGTMNVFVPWHGTEQDTWPDGRKEPRAYFSGTPAQVQSFYPVEGKPVLLRVPVDAAPFRRESTGDWYTRLPIPAAHIEYMNANLNRWLPISTFGENEDVLSFGEPTANSDTVVENSLMLKMGYDYVGKSNARLGSDTYLQKDDPNKTKDRKLVNAVNRNLDKTRKDTLHDPAAVGISLPKRMQG